MSSNTHSKKQDLKTEQDITPPSQQKRYINAWREHVHEMEVNVKRFILWDWSLQKSLALFIIFIVFI